MTTTSPSDGLLRDLVPLLPPGGAASRAGIPVASLRLLGPDAGTFLQRICAQDVFALAPLAVAPAAFLTSKGRIEAIATVVRVADGFVLETAAGAVEGLAALCDRYHFTEKLTIEKPLSVVSELVGVVLPISLDIAPGHAREDAEGTLTIVTKRGGLLRARRHGPADAVVAGFDAPALDPQLAECLRIASGEPQLGLDTDERTLVLEAGLDDHVSTTKGCYVGQEIVARIHTYGHVNRRLVRLRLATVEAVAHGAALVDAELGEAVGRVMSSSRVPGRAFSVALGWLPEAFLREPGALRLGGSEVEVQFVGLAPA